MSQELRLLMILLLLGVGLVLGFKFLFPIVAPFLLGIIFAGLIEPWVRRLETRLTMNRSLAAGLVLFSFLIVVLGLTGLTLLSSFWEAERQLPKIPFLIAKLSDVCSGLLIHLGQLIKYNLPAFSLNSGPVSQVLRSFILWVLGFLPRFPEIILVIAFGGISAYFFSRDRQIISPLIIHCLPENWRITAIQIKDELITKISRFFRAELTLCLITAGLTWAGFFILGIPGAFTYGFLAGILDLIPVIGPGMVYIPYALTQFLMGDIYHGIGLIAVYLMVLLIRQIAELKLIGNNFDFHPLITLMIIYIGIKVFGFSGIFFGPVIIITLRAIYRALSARFVNSI
jgi:sporulation integral membrane protein YtvI